MLWVKRGVNDVSPWGRLWGGELYVAAKSCIVAAEVTKPKNKTSESGTLVLLVDDDVAAGPGFSKV
jgi:hypothetical protein